MFIAALFSTAKIWRQSKRPSTDEWIKKMYYKNIYNGILFSHEKEGNPACATHMMDLEGIMLR